MLILSGLRSQACHPTSYNAQGSQAPTTNHYLTLTVCSKEVRKAFPTILLLLKHWPSVSHMNIFDNRSSVPCKKSSPPALHIVGVKTHFDVL